MGSIIDNISNIKLKEHESKNTSDMSVGRKKGTPKTGGRKAGTPNKATAVIKENIAAVLSSYMTPAGKGKKQSPLQEDLANMLPAERVRAATQLAGYVIPKQQAITIEEQAQLEADALTLWLQQAPDEAIDAIAAKVLDMQAQRQAEAQAQ